MYKFISSFLTSRTIQTKVGNSYSSIKTLQMGIPQGSVIAPMLFNILLHDLPSKLSSKVVLVQYADDICMWMPVLLKKSTKKRQIDYLQKKYQIELNKIFTYMFDNGLTLSSEKTKMMLFNNGQNPSILPTFKLGTDTLNYADSVKFLGIHFSSKLSWNLHIDYIITKARKSLNFMKVVSKQAWGQDPFTLINLANSLVRSKLTYAQETFFSAPIYLLRKLQSIDSKAFKLALGLSLHSSIKQTYREANILPLDTHRALSISKYLVRSSVANNEMDFELNVRSDIDFPKRARNIKSYQTIASYANEIFQKVDQKFELKQLEKNPTYFPVPSWELKRAEFDIDHTDFTKKNNPLLLSSEVKRHICEKYSDHLQIYTDGSVNENKTSGSAFIIPKLNIQRSYHLRKYCSIFTAELVGILMALEYILNFPRIIYNLLICVDSKSVLYSLKTMNLKCRPTVIYQVCNLVHNLRLQGTHVTYCWVPSHLGIYYNERVDFAAKLGADNLFSECINVSLSPKEIYSILECTIRKDHHTPPHKTITFVSKSLYQFLKEKTSSKKM